MPVPLCSWQVNIGTPFTPPQVEGPITKPLLEAVTNMVMERIAALVPDDYRGAYADALRPRIPGDDQSDRQTPAEQSLRT